MILGNVPQVCTWTQVDENIFFGDDSRAIQYESKPQQNLLKGFPLYVMNAEILM